MSRHPEPPDDDDLPPPPKVKKPRVERVEVAAPDDDPPKAAKPNGEEKPLSEQSDRKLLKKLLLYTEEFQMLAGDSSQAAVMRRVELTRLMRAVQQVRDAREELVEIQVPRSVTGEPFVLGPNVFPPGTHIVRSSIAQYLLWMISENQRVEMNRLKSNGRTIDLGTIGSRARRARIARDDGTDTWGGRGT
jgi:hypothetical protein